MLQPLAAPTQEEVVFERESVCIIVLKCFCWGMLRSFWQRRRKRRWTLNSNNLPKHTLQPLAAPTQEEVDTV